MAAPVWFLGSTVGGGTPVAANSAATESLGVGTVMSKSAHARKRAPPQVGQHDDEGMGAGVCDRSHVNGTQFEVRGLAIAKGVSFC